MLTYKKAIVSAYCKGKLSIRYFHTKVTETTEAEIYNEMKMRGFTRITINFA